MAPDERDRSFDKALARHLRSAAPADDSTSLSGTPASRGVVCPDPETLAAYHELSLFPDQLNSLKEHIVGCAHCQTILAHLEATDEISLQAFAPEKVLAKESKSVIAAQNIKAFPAMAAPSQSQPPAASPRRSRRILLMRGARWQWLAPAGALAASLLVWIALHENRPLALPSLNEVRVAKNQAPPAPPASLSKPAQDLSPVAKAAHAKPPAAADEVFIDGANARSATGATKSNEKLDYLAQASPSKAMDDKESRLRKDAVRRSSADSLRAEEQLDRDIQTAGGERQENAQAQLQAQAANSQLQNQSNASSPKLSGPAPLGQMEAKKMKAAPATPASPAPQPTAVGGAVANYDNSPAMEVVNVISNPRLIPAPRSNSLWRAGRSGLIEFSKDGGSSWSRQTSSVLADLLTGSAPSDEVCWIVGRVGAILLTTDGGAHWKLIHSPLAEDLGGVRASDALHATIWNARATKTFQTSDGGQTWTPVPSP